MAQGTEGRLWAKVAVGGPGDCWPWTGALNHGGYGIIKAPDRTIRVHRLAYLSAIATIPVGHDVDHTCHNRDEACAGGPTCLHRRCCNPAHLEAVTHRENLARGRQHNAVKTHCPHGHPYEGDNIMGAADGHRRCRICNRLRSRAYREAQQRV